jgi:Arc/MetJ-type ribon-helix-helix transcriptional regulator
VSELTSVALTRTELVALKEMIELTPVFEGRSEVRDAIREVLRERRPSPLQVKEESLAAVAQRIVPIDVPTSLLRSKMDRELKRVRFAA